MSSMMSISSLLVRGASWGVSPGKASSIILAYMSSDVVALLDIGVESGLAEEEREVGIVVIGSSEADILGDTEEVGMAVTGCAVVDILEVEEVEDNVV